MPRLTYDGLVADLFPRLAGGIRWGLERTTRLLAGVGDPHHAYAVVHVGGTNGKGSVAAHVESVLRAAGHRTGLYTSPHLCSFRERIQIAGSPIGEAALLRAAQRLWPAIQAEAASFFEATTAIAFLALAEAGVEVAVVEVGLGGRLDATNVVRPVVTVLTNVSLDHVQLLGPTIEHVAREKAGIVKAGVPLVTGEHAGPAAAIFADVAAAAGSELHVVGPAAVARTACRLDGTSFDARGTDWGDVALRTPLLGPHQAVNATIAVHALGLMPAGLRPDETALRAGLAATRWPGRLQLERVGGVPWVLDVAHNVAGVQTLTEAMTVLPLPRPVSVVAGVLGDKDWRGMMLPLHGLGGRILLTSPPTAPADRRWDPNEVLAAVPCDRAEVVDDFTAALETAQRTALETGGTVLVTGSFHTVGDALAAFDRCAARSDFSLARPAFITAAPARV